MNVQDYIKVYENVVSDKLCDEITTANLDYKPSTFSDHDGKVENSDNKVIMDDFWITDKISDIYSGLKSVHDSVKDETVESIIEFGLHEYVTNFVSKISFLDNQIQNHFFR